MIRGEFKKKYIKISGHANFNNYGNDIVCASVSSIIYTTVNAILNIDSRAIKYTDNKDFIIEVLKDNEIVNKLIDNMYCLLKDLEEQYPKNINISKGE